MNQYRYAVADDGTISRGRIYRLGDMHGELWQSYWDGDFTDAFTVYWRGWPEFNILTDGYDANRVLHAIEAHRNHGDDAQFIDMLNRPGGLAFRLTGNWDAKFICVGLDQGHDLYALAWSGDPDNQWRDEIEHVNYGDVYRIETERILPEGGGWIEDDDVCEEWYGEDNADAALVKMFPLDEFPAELLIEDRAS